MDQDAKIKKINSERDMKMRKMMGDLEPVNPEFLFTCDVGAEIEQNHYGPYYPDLKTPKEK